MVAIRANLQAFKMTHKQNQNLLNNPDLAPYVLDGETTGKQLGAGSYGSVLEVYMRERILIHMYIVDL